MRRYGLTIWRFPSAALLAMWLSASGVATAQPPRPENYDQLLKQAFAAYQEGDFEAAMFGYERVMGRADDPRDQVRALISLAMIRLLPNSKLRDAEAATIVMDELDRRIAKYGLQHEFFGDIELLHLIDRKEHEAARLRSDNAVLRKEIKRKEETIRQLRAVTVDGG